jgi:hypothetical protein
MKKAKIIISLQVAFLAATIIFSTGIAFNKSAGQGVSLLTADTASNLAIRQKGLEVADPAKNQFQAHLASMDSMLRALKDVSQGRIPSGAEERDQMPGAYIVPFTVPVQSGAVQGTEEAIVVISKNEIPGLQIDTTLSGIEPGVNVYLPAIARTSSAGQVKINDLIVTYGNAAQAQEMLALNPKFRHLLESLGVASRLSELATNMNLQANASREEARELFQDRAYQFDMVKDFEIHPDGAWAFITADVKNDTGGILYDVPLLINQPYDGAKIEVYPVISTISAVKTSSAGKLLLSTDYLRFYAADNTDSVLSGIADSPALKEIIRVANQVTAQPSGDMGKAYAQLLATLSNMPGISILPIKDSSDPLAFMAQIDGRVLMVVNTHTGIKYDVLAKTEPTQLFTDTVINRESMPEEVVAFTGFKSVELTPQLTNALFAFEQAQKSLQLAQLKKSHADQVLAEAQVKPGSDLELLQLDVKDAQKAYSEAYAAQNTAERNLMAVQTALESLNIPSIEVSGAHRVMQVQASGSNALRSSSSGQISYTYNINDIEASRLMLSYSPTGVIHVDNESQAIIVYSDALQDSDALQQVLGSADKGNRRYYLVNKSDMSNEDLLSSIGVAKGVFDHAFQAKDSGTAVMMMKNVLERNNISQVRVFALSEEDFKAWSNETALEVLIMMLKDKRFEIITDYTERHADYIRAHIQALIAA